MAKFIKNPVKLPVTIEFTPDEAQFLKDLLAKVGGNPHQSRRSLAEGISRAFYEAGYDQFDCSDMDGSVRMVNSNG